MFSANTSQVAAGGGAVFVEEIFSTFLYTGNSSTQTITNGIDLSGKGGLVWRQGRSAATGGMLIDTTRGVGSYLISYSTDAAQTGSNWIDSFNSNGFTMNSSSFNGGATYASWTFRKQPKFFDVVTWSGNGTTQTLSHNLGSAPGFIIVKAVSGATAGTQRWACYHQSLGASYAIWLNLSDASFNMGAGVWGNNTTTVTPSATTFTVGADDWVNSASNTYVAYLFAHNAGGFGLTGTDNVISCGSFTTDSGGSFSVNLGYEPQWLLVKNTSDVQDWALYDNMRGLVTQSTTATARLVPNTSAAENSSTNDLGPTSTGFNSIGNFRTSNTYIYIAIRRGPMKVPTSGTSVFSPVTQAGGGFDTAGFPVDLLVLQGRNAATGATWTDRLRGSSKYLNSSSTAAESSTTGIFAFDNQTGVQDNYFGSGTSVAYWNMRRAPSFFDEVCYTGNSTANTQISHNLGVSPELMIVKGRTGTSSVDYWAVYSSATGNTKALLLNDTSSALTSTRYWNDTTPTSSVFTLGDSPRTNGSGTTYVAYLFATCAGVSKVGSYTGNGTTQTINCGFTGGARFVLIKRTNAAGDWYVYDTARGMTTLTDPYLLLNSTAAETATLGSVTTVSTGFALNATILAAINTNGASYIFLAIA